MTSTQIAFIKNLDKIEETKDDIIKLLGDELSLEQIKLLERLCKTDHK